MDCYIGTQSPASGIVFNQALKRKSSVLELDQTSKRRSFRASSSQEEESGNPENESSHKWKISNRDQLMILDDSPNDINICFGMVRSINSPI